MKTLTTALIMSSLLFGMPAIAGTGHSHDADGGHMHAAVSGDEAIIRASTKVNQLAVAGKIDPSWADIKAASVEKKSYANGPEWVITFKNSKIVDPAKQALYVFLSIDGHYIAANYTGN